MVDGVKSSEEPVLSGVPQGTVLGPLMFLLYINDLPTRVHADTRCRLFADDCLLYRLVECFDDQIQLQSDLRELEQWASDWGMQFNPSKCHVLSINSHPSHHHQHFYELCSVVLKSVESEKYLGVTLSSDLSWSSHITAICTKANQKLGFIKRNLKGTPQELKRLAYIAFVRSGMVGIC